MPPDWIFKGYVDSIRHNTPVTLATDRKLVTPAIGERAPAEALNGRAEDSPPVKLAESKASRVIGSGRWPAIRLSIQLAALCGSSLTVMLVAVNPQLAAHTWGLAVLYTAWVLGVLAIRRARANNLETGRIDQFARVVSACSLASISTIAAASVLGVHHAVHVALPLWFSTAGFLGVTQVVLSTIERHAKRSGALARPTLIVGAGMMGVHIAYRLLDRPEYGLRPIGFLDADPLYSGDQAPLPVLGGSKELAEVASRTGARHVIVAFSREDHGGLLEIVERCHQLGLGVSLVPRLYESINQRTTLDHIGGLPLLGLSAVDPRGWQFAIKHMLDRATAAGALLVLSPALLAIAAAVRLSSPGPVIFRQRRVGRDGREFEIYKFRTMLLQTPGERFAPAAGFAPGGVEGLDRRTRIGRLLRSTSLDELPQLINVLRGEMSLVGPRPERPEFAARFAQELDHYEDRHRVKSGLTGWAQVNGLRGQTSIADRVEWDNHYIHNWSLGLELRTLALTVAEVLRFREGGRPVTTDVSRLTGRPGLGARRVIPGDASLTIDARLIVTAISASARRVLGIEESDAIGSPITALLEPAEAEAQGSAGLISAISGVALSGTEVIGSVVRPHDTHGLRLQTRIKPGSSQQETVVILEQTDGQAARASVSSSSASAEDSASVVSLTGRS